MKHPHGIGFEINRLSNEIRHELDRQFSGYEIDNATRIQIHIIDILADNQDSPVFQRDLEEEFRTRRSTISSILRLMEKKGLISRVSVPGDARLKKLLLTDRGWEIHRTAGHEIARMEQRLACGLTQEEQELFFRIMDKIKRNLTDGGRSPKQTRRTEA